MSNCIMKVVQIVSSIGVEASGPSYSVPGLSQGLHQNNVDVELHIRKINDVPITDYKIVTYPWRSFLKSVGFSPEMLQGLKKRAKDVDIIQTNGLWMLPNVYPDWARRGTKCKLVVSPRGSLAAWSLKKGWLKKKLFGMLLQYPVLRNADMFHATCEKEYEEIRALGYKQPVAIVPIGMDIPQGKASVDKHNDNRLHRIVFFGRIHKVKAIDNLVNAWGELYSLLPQWELVIAGPDCGAKAELDAIISDKQIPRVRFVGELNGQAKYDFLADADIYVLPSHTENFGVTVAEALASGTPVIASQGTPWKGLEREGCGRWVPFGVPSLVEALKELTSLSNQERIAMGQRGIDWIRRNYSWQGIGFMMKKAYEWLLGQGDRPDWVRVD